MKLYQALIAGLVACGFVFAQETTAPAAPAAPAATEKAAPVAKVKPKMVIGTVVSVDVVANTIIVKTKKADDTLSLTDKTKVMPKGKKIDDVKADDNVTVAYTVEDGKWVAAKITINPALKAKKMVKKPATEAAPAAPTAPAAPAAPAPTTSTPETK